MPVLMYHRIADDGPAELARWRVSPAEFERQLAWLAEQGYRSARLDEWPEIESRAEDERRVVLTFDDAYLDFLTTALPMLQRYGFGSTMFVPIGFIGGTADWDRAYGEPAPLMSWEQLDTIAAAGVEIGAHTVTHPRLAGLTDTAAIVHEIVRSRAVLSERYRRTIPTFAYPYGDYDERVEQAVKDAGFTVAVTIDAESAGLLALGRIGVFGDEPFSEFAAKVAAASP